MPFANLNVEVRPSWWPGASAEEIGEIVVVLVRDLVATRVDIDVSRIRVTVYYNNSLKERMEGKAKATRPDFHFVDDFALASVMLEEEMARLVEGIHARYPPKKEEMIDD